MPHVLTGVSPLAVGIVTVGLLTAGLMWMAIVIVFTIIAVITIWAMLAQILLCRRPGMRAGLILPAVFGAVSRLFALGTLMPALLRDDYSALLSLVLPPYWSVPAVLLFLEYCLIKKHMAKREKQGGILA
ncbi:MAG: hypothetical protein FWH26_01100 [Oscillospiraceae bacterium]|nr:hypothetical protein [Oscillospiraceae bacterium]